MYSPKVEAKLQDLCRQFKILNQTSKQTKRKVLEAVEEKVGGFWVSIVFIDDYYADIDPRSWIPTEKDEPRLLKTLERFEAMLPAIHAKDIDSGTEIDSEEGKESIEQGI